VDDPTAGHLGSTDRSLTGTTCPLLLERLATGTRDLAATLGLVRSLARCCALGDDDLVDKRNVGLDVERLGGQIDAADLRALRVDDVK
jgi:hypothetical protein